VERAFRETKIIRVISSGGVVYKRRNGKIRVCLINRRRKVWCLPKGHVEKGETLAKTAEREIREETGLSASPIRKLGAIRYQFFENGLRHRKKVHFFLCRYLKGKAHAADREVRQARWFPIDHASEVLTFAGEKIILGKAKRILSDCGSRQ